MVADKSLLPYNGPMMTYEMTELDELRSLYSDYHKDVYGCRPSGLGMLGIQDVKRSIASLDRVAPGIWAAEAELEARAILDVEARIDTMMRLGAIDRAMAIRWLDEAEGTQGDRDYLCWSLGIPYGYFK
jgi:hypothetical protein